MTRACLRLAALLKPVDTLHGFRNNMRQALLDRAGGPDVNDHVRSIGRPQGPTGPMLANGAFHMAVPDLRFPVPQRIVAGDRVMTHPRIQGHFTGTCRRVQGKGQTIDFTAIDDARLRNGRIVDNRPIEGNLIFPKQFEVSQ